MRLLYVSGGHPLSSADMCLMWKHLNIDFFPTAYYTYVNQSGDLPFIDIKRDEKILGLYEKQDRWTNNTDKINTICGQKNFQWTNQVVFNRFKFTNEFLDCFDAILFDHFVENIIENTKVLKGRKVFLRTFAMHNINNEHAIYHLRRRSFIKVIRNSPKEHLLTKNSKPARRFGGLDAMIRGCVVRDEHELSGWEGNIKKVCTFSSFMNEGSPQSQKRKSYYDEIIKRVDAPCEVYGIGNNFIKHNEKLKVLKNYRVNLVTGTPGSNNTYSFVEAWVMGQPMVVFGRDMWQSVTYEADELVDHGVNGFIGNSPKECAEYINRLINNDELAKTISENARTKAVSIYGRDILSKQWAKFFKEEGLKI